MLSASGVNASTMSTLQVTVFEELVGDRTVSCRETGTKRNGRSATITILGESFYHSEHVLLQDSHSILVMCSQSTVMTSKLAQQT